ncbi:MAG: transporter substrate-binding domain-containing protein [Desulfobacteraceae bacterium]
MKNVVLCIAVFLLAVGAHAQPPALVISCDQWEPYQTVDDTGVVGGFSTRIVRYVLEQLDVSIKSLRAYPWKRALDNIKKGRSHALFSANFTRERTRFARYPEEPLVNSPWVLWVKKESGNRFDSMEDLKGKTVGVVRGYSYTREFWEFVKANNAYQVAASDETNFKKLHGDRFEYVVAERGNGFHLLKKLGFDDIVPLDDHPIKSDGLYIMFNREKISRDFVAKFSSELKKFKQQPEYEKLVEEYFSF